MAQTAEPSRSRVELSHGNTRDNQQAGNSGAQKKWMCDLHQRRNDSTGNVMSKKIHKNTVLLYWQINYRLLMQSYPKGSLSLYSYIFKQISTTTVSLFPLPPLYYIFFVLLIGLITLICLRITKMFEYDDK